MSSWVSFSTASVASFSGFTTASDCESFSCPFTVTTFISTSESASCSTAIKAVLNCLSANSFCCCPSLSDSSEFKVATSVFTSCDSDSVGISTSDVGSLSKSCVLSSSTAVALSGAIGCGKIKPRTTMKFTIRFNIFHLNLNGFCTCIL